VDEIEITYENNPLKKVARKQIGTTLKRQNFMLLEDIN
jgi:hypothetical protein